MIRANAIGYAGQVKELLQKSILTMTRREIDIWMDEVFEPENMLLYIEDDIVTSCMQIKKRNYSYQKQICRASVITMACTLPDYRQRGQFMALLDAFLDQAAVNDLVSMVYTSTPKLFEQRSFLPISHTKLYRINSSKCQKGSDYHVHSWTDKIDLYDTYLKFMDYFDGSIILTKKEFEAKLHYELSSRKKIVFIKDHGEIQGFAIYKNCKDYVRIDVLVYFNADAIYDLFRYLSIRTELINFTVTEDERFEKLFDFEYPRTTGTFLVRLNNYMLFNKWAKNQVHNAKEAYENFDNSGWNHFID